MSVDHRLSMGLVVCLVEWPKHMSGIFRTLKA
jgi:hypothetical protein